ncbi:symplekin tight junction carboxy-terminal protein, partial [Toxoplasma gondii CAST]
EAFCLFFRTAFSLVLTLQHAAPEAVRRLLLKLISSPKGIYVVPKEGEAAEPPAWQEPRRLILHRSSNEHSSTPPLSSAFLVAPKSSKASASSSLHSPRSSSSSAVAACDPGPFDRCFEGARGKVEKEGGFLIDQEEREGWTDMRQFGRAWIEACAGIVLRSIAPPDAQFAAPIVTNAFVASLARQILLRSETGAAARAGAASLDAFESQKSGALDAESLQERLSCFVTLCVRRPHLLHPFFEVFLISPSHRPALERLFAKCITQVSPACHPEYVRLLQFSEPEHEPLALLLIEHCVAFAFANPEQDLEHLPALVAAVAQLAVLLPKFIFGEFSETQMKTALKRLLTIPLELQQKAYPGRSVMPPEDILMLLYNLPCTTSQQRKKQTTVLDFCLDLTGCTSRAESPTEIFPIDVIATTCQRIADDDSQPISVIFGRLLCQVAQNIPSLREFVAGTVMPALVRRKIWTNRSLWKGFVMATSILWAERKDLLVRMILVLPEDRTRDLLQHLQQRHPVTADISTFLYQDDQARRSCPHYLRVLLGLTN